MFAHVLLIVAIVATIAAIYGVGLLVARIVAARADRIAHEDARRACLAEKAASDAPDLFAMLAARDDAAAHTPWRPPHAPELSAFCGGYDDECC